MEETPSRFVRGSDSSLMTSLFYRPVSSFASSFVSPIFKCYDISCLDKPRRMLTFMVYVLGGIVSAAIGSKKHSAAANMGLFTAMTAFWILRTPFSPPATQHDTEVMV